MTYFRSELRGGTQIIWLDRAPINALTIAMLQEGASTFTALAVDPPPGGIVLASYHGTFTAGVDTKAAATLDSAGRHQLVDAVNAFAAALYRLPCAVVAAVGGHAIGAGGIICLASDWVLIADTELKIGLPEAKAGLPFPLVPLIIMDQQLDPVWRRRLALSSALLGPNQAVAAGLADEVVPAEQLVYRAVAQAAAMSGQPAFAIIKADLRRKALAEIAAVVG
ncbi:MAG: enoyl-CoA hydratase/isomerase family protein [Sphingopyxis sp.]|nr:enoyl-CoA hydratase/isomerase family protein [Sphingopyxis sp.]